MHTIQELDEFDGALSRSVTSIGGPKCESAIAARIPATKSASLGCGETSGAAPSATDEQIPKPMHSKGRITRGMKHPA
jgi:hypothetical protein